MNELLAIPHCPTYLAGEFEFTLGNLERAVVPGEPAVVVTAILVRRQGEASWRELRQMGDIGVGGLCLGDVLTMAKMWRKFGTEKEKKYAYLVANT
jgi:hypothetical protein